MTDPKKKEVTSSQRANDRTKWYFMINFRACAATKEMLNGGLDGIMEHILQLCYFDFKQACDFYLAKPNDTRKEILNEMHYLAVKSKFNDLLDVDPELICEQIWQESKKHCKEQRDKRRERNQKKKRA